MRPDEVSIPNSLNWLKDAMVADRKEMLRTDALRSAVMIVAAASLMWFFLKKKIRLTHTLLGLSLLFLVDQIPVDARFLGSANFETKRSLANTFAPTTADKDILQDKGEYRVLSLAVSTFNDASTSYHHKSIGGYSGAKLKRYQELVESSLTDEINALISRLRNSTSYEEAENVMENCSALNMLNTKYIILSPDAPPLVNNYALGDAWFVSKVSLVENADAELQAIKTVNPAEIAVVDRKFGDQILVNDNPGSPSDTIYLTAYKPNLLTYKTELSSDRVAVFSEIYYPKGWQAYIDDVPADHFRTDYVLRGMVVPSGSHAITFGFEPQSYKTGNKVSLISSVILLALLIYATITGLTALRRNG
jgi:hypothetical protein